MLPAGMTDPLSVSPCGGPHKGGFLVRLSTWVHITLRFGCVRPHHIGCPLFLRLSPWPAPGARPHLLPHSSWQAHDPNTAVDQVLVEINMSKEWQKDKSELVVAVIFFFFLCVLRLHFTVWKKVLESQQNLVSWVLLTKVVHKCVICTRTAVFTKMQNFTVYFI